MRRDDFPPVVVHDVQAADDFALAGPAAVLQDRSQGPFAQCPLGRVERVSASMLFRDEVAHEPTMPRTWVVLATLGVAAALVGFALLTSDSKRIAIYFTTGLVVVFAVFAALGWAVTWAARRLPRPRYPELALALGNLARVYQARGDFDRAIELNARSAAVWERSMGPDHPDLAMPLVGLCELEIARGRPAKAIDP